MISIGLFHAASRSIPPRAPLPLRAGEYPVVPHVNLRCEMLKFFGSPPELRNWPVEVLPSRLLTPMLWRPLQSEH
jgi:hypothetical protein